MVWCNVKLRLNLQSHRFNFLTQSVSCISITKYLVKMQSVLWVLFHIESCISFAYGRTNTMTWITYTYHTIPKGYYLNFQFPLTFTSCIFTYFSANLFSWYFHRNIVNLNLVKLQYVYNSKHRLLVSPCMRGTYQFTRDFTFPITMIDFHVWEYIIRHAINTLSCHLKNGMVR